MTFIPAISWYRKKNKLLFHEMTLSALHEYNKAGFDIVLTHKNYNARTQVSLHWMHYSDSEQSSDLHLFIIAICLYLFHSIWFDDTWCEFSNHNRTVLMYCVCITIHIFIIMTKLLVSLEYVRKEFVLKF